MDEVKESTAEAVEAASEMSQDKPQGKSFSPDEIEKLQLQLKDKEARYMYLYADFENFKKRTAKEKSDDLKYGWQSLARDLLQVLDNLERALSHASSEPGQLVEGLKMVVSQFRSSMQKQGVETIDCLNRPFDPNLHEAIGQEASELPAGTVTKEESKGYTLHGRLLRPARVLVSQGLSN